MKRSISSISAKNHLNQHLLSC